jgi:hypothetical protein
MAGVDFRLEGSAGFVAATAAPIATGLSDPLPGGICTRLQTAPFTADSCFCPRVPLDAFSRMRDCDQVAAANARRIHARPLCQAQKGRVGVSDRCKLNSTGRQYGKMKFFTAERRTGQSGLPHVSFLLRNRRLRLCAPLLWVTLVRLACF